MTSLPDLEHGTLKMTPNSLTITLPWTCFTSRLWWKLSEGGFRRVRKSSEAWLDCKPKEQRENTWTRLASFPTMATSISYPVFATIQCPTRRLKSSWETENSSWRFEPPEERSRRDRSRWPRWGAGESWPWSTMVRMTSRRRTTPTKKILTSMQLPGVGEQS